MSDRKSRRDFVGLAAAGVTGALTPAWLSAAHAQAARVVATVEPDLIVVDAVVHTMDGAVPRAQAFAVRASRFVALGSSADMRASAGPRTLVIDAKGATIVKLAKHRSERLPLLRAAATTWTS